MGQGRPRSWGVPCDGAGASRGAPRDGAGASAQLGWERLQVGESCTSTSVSNEGGGRRHIQHCVETCVQQSLRGADTYSTERTCVQQSLRGADTYSSLRGADTYRETCVQQSLRGADTYSTERTCVQQSLRGADTYSTEGRRHVQQRPVYSSR